MNETISFWISVRYPNMLSAFLGLCEVTWISERFKFCRLKYFEGGFLPCHNVESPVKTHVWKRRENPKLLRKEITGDWEKISFVDIWLLLDSSDFYHNRKSFLFSWNILLGYLIIVLFDLWYMWIVKYLPQHEKVVCLNLPTIGNTTNN